MTIPFVLFVLSCTDSEKNNSSDSASTSSNDTAYNDEIPLDTAENQGLESCENLSLPLNVTVDSCLIAPETGTVSFVEEWSIEEFMPFPEYSEILRTPLIAQLTDDNGDGKMLSPQANHTSLAIFLL